MRSSNRKSWQDKIDPVFDSMITSYVKLLDGCEELPKGYLSLNDLSEQLDLEEPWWKTVNIKDNGQDDVSQNGETADDIDQDLLNIFSYTKEDKKEYFDSCLKIAEELPEESKAFYIKKIQSFLEDPSIKPPFSLFETPTKKNMDLYSVIGSLIMRFIFLGFEEDKDSDVSDEEMELFKKSKIMNFFIGFIYSLLSSIVYKETPTSLLNKFLNGDDQALFRAISINKTVLYYKEVKERILKAQFTGDNKFFRGLGNAIASAQFKNVRGYGRLFPVLIIFWSFGLYRLTRLELYSLLIQSRIIPRQYSYDALDKLIQRYILPYFKN